MLIANSVIPLPNEKRFLLIDLRNDDFVLFPEGYILQEIAVDACNSVGFITKYYLRGEDMDAIKGLVAAGIGVTSIARKYILRLHTSVTV